MKYCTIEHCKRLVQGKGTVSYHHTEEAAINARQRAELNRELALKTTN